MSIARSTILSTEQRLAEKAAEMEIQIARLPKWARDHITHLQRAVDSKEALLDAMRNGHEESPFSITHVADDAYMRDGRIFRLPALANLYAFRPSDRDSKDTRDEMSIDANLLTKTLTVRSTHGRGLVIRPEATNCISLRAEDW